MPPIAAAARTLKVTTANMNFWPATIAAAASALLGSALLVSSTQPPESDSGSRTHFALQMAVAVKVSDENGWLFMKT